jgi:hypothetical protein
MAEPTQTFGPWLRAKLVEAGEIAPDAQGVNLDPKVRDAYLRMWQNESKAGSSFTPTAIAVTNPVDTNQVVPMIMTSPGSAMPFPQPGFKEGRVNDQGVALVFDDRTGTYFPATNTATQTAVKPDARSSSMAELIEAMANPPGGGARGPAPSGLLGFLGVGGGGAPTPSPTPMATPMPTPTPAAAAMTNASAPAPTPMGETFSREQFRQMTGQDLPPGEYADAQGRPFLIR